jgi:hypothetical protein
MAAGSLNRPGQAASRPAFGLVAAVRRLARRFARVAGWRASLAKPSMMTIARRSNLEQGVGPDFLRGIAPPDASGRFRAPAICGRGQIEACTGTLALSRIFEGLDSTVGRAVGVPAGSVFASVIGVTVNPFECSVRRAIESLGCRRLGNGPSRWEWRVGQRFGV